MINLHPLLAAYLGGMACSLLLSSFVIRCARLTRWRFLLPLVILWAAVWPVLLPLVLFLPRAKPWKLRA